jgi:phosphoribosylformimino-5-aminoimidazole carboxamide ribotide isomerase
MPERAIEVIPVIDLKGAAVVRVRHTSRHSYAPIVTPLARTSAPLDVVAGFLTVHPFHTNYAADLDRIESSGSHDQSLDALSTAFPDVAFWVDAGVRDGGEARSWLAATSACISYLEANPWMAMGARRTRHGRPCRFNRSTIAATAFSRQNGFAMRRIWPARVLGMTRARVGGDGGPDMDRLADIKRRAPDVMLYAAGGLRGASDLVRLKQAGIWGVLVASALHEGDLIGADLAAVA